VDAGAIDAGLPPPRDTVELIVGNSATGFVDGVGVAARFNGPSGAVLSPDGRTMYVADTFNSLLRRLDLQTGEVRTLLGRVQVQSVVDGDAGVARLQSPRGMAITSDGGLLFLADGPTVRRVDVNSLEITTIAGTPGMSGYVDGTGSAVRLGFLLHSFAMGADDRTLYIADRSNRVIRTCDVETGVINTIAGQRDAGVANVDGIGTAARFSGIGGLIRLGSTLYVADTFNHTLRSIDLTTNQVTTRAGIAGTAGIEDGDAGVATFDSPQSLAWDGTSFYVTSFQGLLRRVNGTTFAVDTVLGDFEDTSTVDGPAAQVRLGSNFGPPTFDPTRNVLYLQDRTASSVRAVQLPSFTTTTVAGASEPSVLRDGPALSARFSDPDDIVSNPAGDRWYISDPGSNTIRVYNGTTGTLSTLAGAANTPGSTDGPLAMARFGSPAGLALNSATNTLYVSDTQLHVIRAIDLSAGVVSTLAGDANAATPSGNVDGVGPAARFNSPRRIVLSPSGQTLYVADASNRVIRAISIATQAVTRLAGTGTAGTVNGALLAAQFRTPAGLAINPAGTTLYVSDSAANTVRAIDLMGGMVSTLAGTDNTAGPTDGAFATALFRSPVALSLGAAGTALYVSDSSNHMVRRLDLVSQMVTTYLGSPSRNGGFAQGVPVPLSQATTYFPSAVRVVGNNLLLVSDYGIYILRPTLLP